MRAFLACRKEEAVETVDLAKRIIERFVPDCEVVTSGEHYEKTFSSFERWEDWTASISDVILGTEKPQFDRLYVLRFVPSGQKGQGLGMRSAGNATGQIIEGFFARGRRLQCHVLEIQEDRGLAGTIYPLTGFRIRAGASWKENYELFVQ